jgi:hypothetical protein
MDIWIVKASQAISNGIALVEIAGGLYNMSRGIFFYHTIVSFSFL